MSDELSEDLLRTPYVEATGPWHREEWEFNVGGYRVPYVQANIQGETNWLLVLDRRFMLEASHEEVQRWMPFLAHAMAVAAGYSCHGANCTPLNPFSVRVGCIDEGPE